MSYTYTEIFDEEGNLQCVNRSDGWSIPIDKANSDYKAYLVWLENPQAALSTPVVSGDE